MQINLACETINSMKSQKGNVLVLVLGGLAVIFAAGMIYFYLQIPKGQPVENISNYTKTIPDSKPVDETASWKTYTNSTLGFSIKYPPDKNFIVSSGKSDDIFIMVPRSDYGLAIRKIGDSRGLGAKSLALEGIANSGTETNRKRVTSSDYTFNPVTIAGENGIQVVGPTPSYS